MVQNLFGAVAHRYPFDYHKVGLCYSKPFKVALPKGRKRLFLFYLLQFFFFFFWLPPSLEVSNTLVLFPD